MNGTASIPTDARSLDDWHADLLTIFLPSSVLLILYLVLGVIGNSVVIYIHACRLTSNKEERFFIPVLAVVDLTACIICAPITFLDDVLNIKFGNDSACKTLTFLSVSVSAASVFLLLAIAVDRHRRICKPFGKQLTFFWKKIVVFVITVSSIVLPLPCFVIYGVDGVYDVTGNVTGHKCANRVDPGLKYVPIIFNVVLLLIVLGIVVSLVVLYTLIGRVVLKHINLRRKLNSPYDTTTRNTSLRDIRGLSLPDIKGNNTTSQATSQENRIWNTSDEMKQNGASPRPDTRNALNMYTKSSNTLQQKTENTPASRQPPVKVPGIRMALMFMLITFVFILCYIPKVVLMAVESQVDDFWSTLPDTVHSITRVFYTAYIINNIVNPLVYGLFDRRFRREAGMMFCCKKCIK